MMQMYYTYTPYSRFKSYYYCYNGTKLRERKKQNIHKISEKNKGKNVKKHWERENKK